MKSRARYLGSTSGRSLTAVSAALAVLLFAWLVGFGWAQDTPVYTVLYTFTGAGGSNPFTGLIRDKAGNLYGTSVQSGLFSCGEVFKLDPFGHDTSLYSFTCGTDGSRPSASVALDPAGNVYGTASRGGGTSCNSGQGCGTIFKLNPSGAETTLYAFEGGTDGACPLAPLNRDTRGNLYGTTFDGGDPSCNCGTVFKLDTSNVETVLYAFKGGTGGSSPAGPLTRDATDNLYGTAGGGAFGFGVVFKLDASNNETVLYSFTGGSDGAYPQGGVIMDAAGNLYGTTSEGGDTSCFAPNGCGTIFKLDATGKKTVLRTFTGGSDGAIPAGDIIRDGAGNLYGTTVQGGAYGQGVVFRLTATGRESILHAFTGGVDGASPQGGVIADSTGNLYGIATNGGVYSLGVAFKISLK
ncbi:MAG TPA: choice-of-anchor tandem repeat GloVer-containing protein [Terriglobia bacterium]|nr:choice-of-anchor tandem repeat GloVer-containing protein [Terriglobia bacterium]